MSLWTAADAEARSRVATYHPDPWHLDETVLAVGLWYRTERRTSMRDEVNAMARLGEELSAGFAEDFVQRNKGRFAALGLVSRRVIGLADNMSELAHSLAANPPDERYHIVRIGYRTIGLLR